MTTPDPQLEQRRRTVRVLELLDQSYAAGARGDIDALRAAITEAVDTDLDALAVIQGGIVIGEIPNPSRDPDGWAEYVQAARDALAEAERTAGPGRHFERAQQWGAVEDAEQVHRAEKDHGQGDG